MAGPPQPSLRLRDRALEWRVLQDETIVLDLEGSRYLAINDTGTLLWPLLAAGATRAQLVAAVTARWDIEPGQAARDVDAFCRALDDEGLLERHG
jgi:hypothetical protein